MEKETALATLQIDPTTTNHICASKFLAEHIFAAQARCSHQHDVLQIQPNMLSLLAFEDEKVSALREVIWIDLSIFLSAFDLQNCLKSHNTNLAEVIENFGKCESLNQQTQRKLFIFTNINTIYY